MSSTMRDGETAREYADRLQRERQEASAARSWAWEARRREQAQQDLKIAQQMAALAEQLNSLTRGQPRAASPIQTVPATGLLADEIAERIEAFIQVLELYARST